MDFAHAEHVLAVPISGWQDYRFVEEIIDGGEQLFPLVDAVAYIVEFLQPSREKVKFSQN